MWGGGAHTEGQKCNRSVLLPPSPPSQSNLVTSLLVSDNNVITDSNVEDMTDAVVNKVNNGTEVMDNNTDQLQFPTNDNTQLF